MFSAFSRRYFQKSNSLHGAGAGGNRPVLTRALIGLNRAAQLV